MTYLGRIENGAIVLDEAAVLPDGARVRVELMPSSEISKVGESSGRTLYDRYKSGIGKAQGLPADFAAQHDHYIHGTPKRE